ncbi:SusD/RagB family nutrient-binding outer membrane lipoprotein [Halosquirtibacter xylanolyticus]|uniref:SusD/RagB family nutrient-binding outer membrane lipoprotein n=1 Tax=Halosquirtibacter xylanolyticus TaxID=3374599 RepID=UPI003748E8B6|nr:SusD/RagB family nutrient-binding outer membrane lipoprotein [Prolixibacteraceae bacterium]
MFKLSNIKRIVPVALLLGGMVSGCTDGFEDINTSIKPEYSTDNAVVFDGEHYDEDINKLISPFIFEGPYADYQRATNLFHDIYAHYFSHNKADFSGLSPNYVYNDGWIGKRWEHFYYERVKEYRSLVKKMNAAPVWNAKAKAVADINFSFLTSMMVDTYGYIPYKYVFEENISEATKLEYDSDRDIYIDLFKQLKNASAVLAKASDVDQFHIAPGSDNYYQGDYTKWRKFANTLRLRLALRVSGVDPILAKEEGESAIADGVFSSNSDNLATHMITQENIYYLCSNAWLDAVMTKDLEIAYKSWSENLDPRCGALWYKTGPEKAIRDGFELPALPGTTFGQYIGHKVGQTENLIHSTTNVSILKTNALQDPKGWFSIHREIVWLGYSETCFLMSEASLRGWTGASMTPKSYYIDGVKASMEYFQISEDNANKYVSGLKDIQDGIFEGSDKEKVLEAIHKQKWLAIFPNGNEGWAEFRRTGYPRLLNNDNNMSATVKQGLFIKRIRYTVKQHDYNEKNIPSDIYGADDRMDVRIWWDVDNSNDDSGKPKPQNNFR